MTVESELLAVPEHKKLTPREITTGNATHANIVQWGCCCSKRPTDARLLTYIIRVIISIMILIFSLYKIGTVHECDPLLSFYTSTITFILGAYLGESKYVNGKK